MINFNPVHWAYKPLIVFHALCSGITVSIEGQEWIYDIEVDQFGIITKQNNKSYIFFPKMDMNYFVSACRLLPDEQISELLSKLLLNIYTKG